MDHPVTTFPPVDYSVSFESADVLGGMGVCHGGLRLSPRAATLVVEWQVKDGLLGVVKSGVKSRTLQIGEITGAAYKAGVIGGKVTLRAHSMSSVADIPGAEGNTLTLSIPRRHRTAAKALVGELEVLLSERALGDAASGTGLPT
jgi:hypothetical protein